MGQWQTFEVPARLGKRCEIGDKRRREDPRLLSVGKVDCAICGQARAVYHCHGSRTMCNRYCIDVGGMRHALSWSINRMGNLCSQITVHLLLLPCELAIHVLHYLANPNDVKDDPLISIGVSTTFGT